MKRENVITIRLNDIEYAQLLDLLDKFNSNPKRNQKYSISKLIRVFILWEYERLCQKER